MRSGCNMGGSGSISLPVALRCWDVSNVSRTVPSSQTSRESPGSGAKILFANLDGHMVGSNCFYIIIS
jgi:hypothetical protein